MPHGVPDVLFNTVLFTGNANPVLAQEIATQLGSELGKAKVGLFSDGAATSRSTRTSGHAMSSSSSPPGRRRTRT